MAEQIISLRPESVVVRTNGRVYKSYRPDQFAAWKERYASLGINTGTDQYLEGQRILFNHEYAIVRALSTLGKQVTPKFHGALRERDKLHLEFDYVDAPSYQDMVEDVWHSASPPAEKEKKIDDLTEEMVLTVGVPFHTQCNMNIERLVASSRLSERAKERVMLKMRTPEDRLIRLSRHIKSILLYCSTELNDYFEQKSLDPDVLTDGQHEKDLRKYMAQFARRYDITERLSRVERLEQQIGGPEAGFVAGDLSPQNVFHTGDPECIRVFDFDKARRGKAATDLFTMIYNIHRFPTTPNKEAFAVNLAGEYFKRSGCPPAQLPERIASFVSTSLLEALRFWGLYCQMLPADMRKFVGERDLFPDMENGALRQKIITEVFPLHFRQLFDYYRFRAGEGWEVILEEPLSAAGEKGKDTLTQIREQFRLIEDILTETGCLRGEPRSQSRVKRINRTFAER